MDAGIIPPLVARSGPQTIQIGEYDLPAEFAHAPLSQARGHMFRLTPPSRALVFPFDDAGRRLLHMLCVPVALDAVYALDGCVEAVSEMRPMIGWSSGVADTIIELPAGEYDISVGDAVRL